MIPVIICGGIGTKMWPESRHASPKQFLPLFNGKSLFQINWETLRMRFSPEEIYLQTTAEQAAIAKAQIPEIISENVLLEPEMRNQGPATGLAAARLYQIYPDEPFMIVQADVMRTPGEHFLKMLDICDRLARETNKYITGGLKPTYPVQGVDYLIPGDIVSSTEHITVSTVKKFLWRAGSEEITTYMQQGALIHTNHSCMTPRNMLAMFKKYRPDWHEPLMRIAEGADVTVEYSKMPAGPIEEVTQQVHAHGESLVVALPFEWIDFGTWESLMNYSSSEPKDANIEEVDSSGNFVRVQTGKQVALIGIHDLVVVDTPDALLICPKTESGRVGEVVERLKNKQKNHLL